MPPTERQGGIFVLEGFESPRNKKVQHPHEVDAVLLARPEGCRYGKAVPERADSPQVGARRGGRERGAGSWCFEKALLIWGRHRMKKNAFHDFWGLSEEERKNQYQYLSDHDKFLVRISMNPGVVSSQCNYCRHYWGFGRCDAYPDNIPREIMGNQFEHTAPYKGDNGIWFEPKQE